MIIQYHVEKVNRLYFIKTFFYLLVLGTWRRFKNKKNNLSKKKNCFPRKYISTCMYFLVTNCTCITKII